MPTVIARKTILASVGTVLRPRVTVRDMATRAAKDLSGYSVRFGIKASAEDTTYLVEPVTGSGDASGHLDATISDTLMAAVPPGDCVGEFAASIAGAVALRVRIPIQVEPRVIV